MTLLKEAEQAWKNHPKPRKRALRKSIENLKIVDGALEDLMLSYLKATFILNYIEQNAHIHEAATEAKT
jgi:hypothetical protein